MNVLVVEAGFLPYEREINGLSEMQEIVGGSIAAIFPFDELIALVRNENARYEHLEFNRAIPERSYGGIFGTFFVCGLGEENFISLTPEQVKTYTERFKKAELLLAMEGEKPITAKVNATKKFLTINPKEPRKSPQEVTSHAL